jgi:hypothetical protein
MLLRTPTTAVVAGTQARLELTGSFYGPESTVRLVGVDDRVLDEFSTADTVHGLHFEAVEAARCLSEGQTESSLMPHASTLSVMAALDTVRAQLGVRFPNE